MKKQNKEQLNEKIQSFVKEFKMEEEIIEYLQKLDENDSDEEFNLFDKLASNLNDK